MSISVRENKIHSVKDVHKLEYIVYPARAKKPNLSLHGIDVGIQFDKRNDIVERNYLGERLENKGSAMHHKSRSYTEVGVGNVKTCQKKKVKKVYLLEPEATSIGCSDSHNVKRTSIHYYGRRESKPSSSKCVGGGIIKRKHSSLHKKVSPIVTTMPNATSFNQKLIAKSDSPRKERAPQVSLSKETTEIPVSSRLHSTELQPFTENINTKLEQFARPVISIDNTMSDKYEDTIGANLPVATLQSKECGNKFDCTSHYNAQGDNDIKGRSSSDSFTQKVQTLDNADHESEFVSSNVANDVFDKDFTLLKTKGNDKDLNSIREKVGDGGHKTELKKRFEALRRNANNPKNITKSLIEATPLTQVSICKPSRVSKNELFLNATDSKPKSHSFYNKEGNVSELSKAVTSECSKSCDDIRSFNSNTSTCNTCLSSLNLKVAINKYEKLDSNNISKKCSHNNQSFKSLFKLFSKHMTPHKKSNQKIETPDKHKIETLKEANFMKPKIPAQVIEEWKEFKNFFKKKQKYIKHSNEDISKSGKKNTVESSKIKTEVNIKSDAPKESLEPQKVIEKIFQNFNETKRKACRENCLTGRNETINNTQLRWRSDAANSTVFELMEDLYSKCGVVLNRKSELGTDGLALVQSMIKQGQSSSKTASFKQNFEAWMMPETLILPGICESNKNIVVSYSNQKCYIDKSCLFSQTVDVVFNHSNTIRRTKTDNSSDYLRINIPQGFFSGTLNSDIERNQTSDEEVFKVIEYDTDASKPCLKNKSLTINKNLEVTVSVKEENHKPEIMKTVLKSTPGHRDVILQGSNVFLPKKCDVIEVGIVTHKDLKVNRKKSQIKIFELDDSGLNSCSRKKKKSGVADSYLQNFCKYYIPLGLDVNSWCESDSHIKFSSDIMLCNNFDFEDGPKSCPNIFESQNSTSSFDSSIASESYIYKYEMSGFKEKAAYFSSIDITQTNQTSEKPKGADGRSLKSGSSLCDLQKLDMLKKYDDDDRECFPSTSIRVMPKDSLDVFKKRKIYSVMKSKAPTNYSKDNKEIAATSLDKANKKHTQFTCPKCENITLLPCYFAATESLCMGESINKQDTENKNMLIQEMDIEKRIYPVMSASRVESCIKRHQEEKENENIPYTKRLETPDSLSEKNFSNKTESVQTNEYRDYYELGIKLQTKRNRIDTPVIPFPILKQSLTYSVKTKKDERKRATISPMESILIPEPDYGTDCSSLNYIPPSLLDTELTMNKQKYNRVMRLEYQRQPINVISKPSENAVDSTEPTVIESSLSPKTYTPIEKYCLVETQTPWESPANSDNLTKLSMKNETNSKIVKSQSEKVVQTRSCPSVGTWHFNGKEEESPVECLFVDKKTSDERNNRRQVKIDENESIIRADVIGTNENTMNGKKGSTNKRESELRNTVIENNRFESKRQTIEIIIPESANDEQRQRKIVIQEAHRTFDVLPMKTVEDSTVKGKNKIKERVDKSRDKLIESQCYVSRYDNKAPRTLFSELFWNAPAQWLQNAAPRIESKTITLALSELPQKAPQQPLPLETSCSNAQSSTKSKVKRSTKCRLPGVSVGVQKSGCFSKTTTNSKSVEAICLSSWVDTPLECSSRAKYEQGEKNIKSRLELLWQKLDHTGVCECKLEKQMLLSSDKCTYPVPTGLCPAAAISTDSTRAQIHPFQGYVSRINNKCEPQNMYQVNANYGLDTHHDDIRGSHYQAPHQKHNHNENDTQFIKPTSEHTQYGPNNTHFLISAQHVPQDFPVNQIMHANEPFISAQQDGSYIEPCRCPFSREECPRRYCSELGSQQGHSTQEDVSNQEYMKQRTYVIQPGYCQTQLQKPSTAPVCKSQDMSGTSKYPSTNTYVNTQTIPPHFSYTTYIECSDCADDPNGCDYTGTSGQRANFNSRQLREQLFPMTSDDKYTYTSETDTHIQTPEYDELKACNPPRWKGKCLETCQNPLKVKHECSKSCPWSDNKQKEPEIKPKVKRECGKQCASKRFSVPKEEPKPKKNKKKKSQYPGTRSPDFVVPVIPPEIIRIPTMSKMVGLHLKKEPYKSSCPSTCGVPEDLLVIENENACIPNCDKNVCIRVARSEHEDMGFMTCCRPKAEPVLDQKSPERWPCGNIWRNNENLLNDLFKPEINRVSTIHKINTLEKDSNKRVTCQKSISDDSLAKIIEINLQLKFHPKGTVTDVDIVKSDSEAKDTKETQGEHIRQRIFQEECYSDQVTPSRKSKNDVNIRIFIKKFNSKPHKNKRRYGNSVHNEYPRKISDHFNTVSVDANDWLDNGNDISKLYPKQAGSHSASSLENNLYDIASPSVHETESSCKSSEDSATSQQTLKNESNKYQIQEKLPMIGDSNYLDNIVTRLLRKEAVDNSAEGAAYLGYGVTDTSHIDINSTVFKQAKLDAEARKQYYVKEYKGHRVIHSKDSKNKTPIPGVEYYNNYKEKSDGEKCTQKLSDDKSESGRLHENNEVDNKHLVTLVPKLIGSRKNGILTDRKVNNIPGLNTNINSKLNELTREVNIECPYECQGKLKSTHGYRAKIKCDVETNCDAKHDQHFVKTVETQNPRCLRRKDNAKKADDVIDYKIPDKLIAEVMDLPDNLKDIHDVSVQRKKSVKKTDYDFKRHKNRTKLGISDDGDIIFLDRSSADLLRQNGRKENNSNKRAQKRYVGPEILQLYETKKAVLEIYAEKTVTDKGEAIVAKLPKFLNDTDISSDCEKCLGNCYKGFCKRKNIVTR